MLRRTLLVLAILAASVASAHDIPNARVDRAIQVELRPSVVEVLYEVSLAELTLTQDLRSLIGGLPEGDRETWFRRYGEETAPLNGRGLMLVIDGEPVDLESRGFEVAIEEHPRFTFRYEAVLPGNGSLRLIDTNYAASEGSSRLAVRSRGAVIISGADRPRDVHSIPIRPAWELTPEDDRRGKRVDLTFGPGTAGDETTASPSTEVLGRPPGLLRLLDAPGYQSWPFLALVAYFLGVVHSIQPGHGKLLVAAGSVGQGGRLGRGVTLALIATSAHMASVSAMAGVLWVTRATDYPGWNATILHVSGFVITALGLFRLGRIIGKVRSIEAPSSERRAGLVAIGLAAGAVPCWDAIGMLVMASAIGRLPMGLVLVACFSLGMATVLVAVGMMAVSLSHRACRAGDWSQRLRILGAVVLTLIGGTFLLS